MDPQRFRHMAEIFEAATGRPAGDRASYIDQVCANDEELRSRLHSLLIHFENSHDSLQSDWLDRAATDRSLFGINRDPLVGPAGLGSSFVDQLALKEIGAVLENPSIVKEENVGGFIDRYELLEKIGEGGFGTVYRARQTAPLVREVALKIVKAGMDTREVIARFEAERQTLALMDHPCIARVFDAGATPTGRPYFVMELVGGVAITQYATEHGQSLRQRLELFARVCHAVQHAHQKGIIHRDIKPTNVLVVEQDGRAMPKVIDFGVAKATQDLRTSESLMTLEGHFIGTPAYMSPEQANRQCLDIDTRSDIYSLGVLLYELLSGTTPFSAGTLMRGGLEEMLRIIREVEPSLPSSHAPALRGELDWIIMNCLEKDRADRYSSAGALAEDVERHLRNDPVLAGPPSAFYRFRKLVRRNRGLFAAGTMMAAMLLVAVVSITYGLFEARAQRDIAEAAKIEESRQRVLAEQRRKEAERQENIANAVTHFLSFDLLGGDNITRSFSSPNERISDVLKRAEERVDAGILSDQPLVEASIRSVIGGTYAKLGRLDDAERHHRRALEITQADPAASDNTRVICMSSLAAVQRNAGRIMEAAECYRKVINLARHGEEISEDVLALACVNYGELLRNMGSLDEAGRLYDEALTALQSSSGRTRKTTDLRAGLFSELGELARTRKDYDAAIKWADDALACFRELYGREHPAIATTLNNKGLALKLRGDISGAESLYRESLEIRRKVLPAGHLDVAMSLNNLASLLRDSNRPGDAEPLYRETLEIAKKTLPPGHFQIALIHRNLGNCLLQLERFSEAEAELRTAYDALSKMPGLPPDHVRMTIEAFVKLYDEWAKARPKSKAAAKAIKWKARLKPSASSQNKARS